jgi:iron complex outermembrane receptor protein
MTATLHYAITKNFDVCVEGKNLTNSIVRSYLNGGRSLVCADGEATGRSPGGVGA